MRAHRTPRRKSDRVRLQIFSHLGCCLMWERDRFAESTIALFSGRSRLKISFRVNVKDRRRRSPLPLSSGGGEGEHTQLATPSINRGRDGDFAPPLPPNRTGGFPASGSPVSDF